MILLDITSFDEHSPLIGLQRKNRKYTYLNWDEADGLFKMSEYHVMIADNYPGIEGIGPTCLVEWSDEDEDYSF